MPDIRELRDNDGNVIFPITHIDAVFDSEGKSIVEQLGNINIDAIKEIDVLNELDNREFENITSMEYETIDGYIENFHIKGKTLVNLVTKLYRINGSDADGIVRTRFDSYGDNFWANKRISNGTFTFYNKTDKVIGFVGKDINDNWTVYIRVDPFSYKVETLSESQSVCGVDFGPSDGWSNANLSIYVPEMAMVIEGEHGDLPYFKGVASVGDSNAFYNAHPAAPHIELFNLGEEVDISNLTYHNGYINDADGKIYYPDQAAIPWEFSNEYIQVSDKTDYILEANINTCFFDKDYKHVPIYWGNGVYVNASYDYMDYGGYGSIVTESLLPNHGHGHVLIRPPKKSQYIRINKNKKKTARLWKNYDKANIHLNLRSLPNGAYDEIVCYGDRYYIIKRCETITLDGSDDQQLEWVNFADNSRSVVRFGVKVPNAKLSHEGTEYNCMSDLFKSERNAYWDADQEHVDEDGVKVNINISKARLTSVDLNGIKTWLKNNPVTIVYELSVPVIAEISNLNITTFNGNNKFFVSSGPIQAEASFEITTNLGSKIQAATDLLSSVRDMCVYNQKECVRINEWVAANSYYINENYNSLKSYTDLNVSHLQTQINTRNQYAKLSESNGGVIRLTNVDLNTVTTTGFYDCNIATNSPNSAQEWWYLQVYRHSNNDQYCHQVLTALNNTDEVIQYQRIRRAGNWSPWVRL